MIVDRQRSEAVGENALGSWRQQLNAQNRLIGTVLPGKPGFGSRGPDRP